MKIGMLDGEARIDRSSQSVSEARPAKVDLILADTSGKMDRRCLFLLFGSTRKKTQESTPSILTEIKENIILPFFTTGRFGPLAGRRDEGG